MHGATAHAIGAALSEEFVYDEEGNAPDLQLLRLPRAARHGHAAAEDGQRWSRRRRSRRSARRGMGEGGGGGIHCICAAIQDALAAAGKPIVSDELQPAA